MIAACQVLLQSAPRPVDTKQAAHLLWALLSPFGVALHGIAVRGRPEHPFRELTERNAEEWIAKGRLGQLPGDWVTHRVQFRFGDAEGISGTARFRVASTGQAPGVDIFFDLPGLPFEEAEAAFRSSLATGMATAAFLSPAETFVENVGLLTYGTGKLPVLGAGAVHSKPFPRVEPLGKGWLAFACSPHAAPTEIAAAAASLAQELRAGAHVLLAAPVAAHPAEGPTRTLEPRPISVPAPTPVPLPPVDPDETLPIPIPGKLASPTPFTKAPPPKTAEVAAMFAPTSPREQRAEADPDETAMLPAVTIVASQTGGFTDRLGPVVVPLLSLDEYAELRAHLSLHGEDHSPTLARFGVMSREANAALRARFAEYFQREPAAQAAFLAAMQTALARLKAQP